MGISVVLTGYCISMGMSWSFTSTFQPFGLELSSSKASDLIQALCAWSHYKITNWWHLRLLFFFFFLQELNLPSLAELLHHHSEGWSKIHRLWSRSPGAGLFRVGRMQSCLSRHTSARIWPKSRSSYSVLSLQGGCGAQWKVPGKLTEPFCIFSNTGVCFNTSVLTSPKPLTIISSKALIVEWWMTSLFQFQHMFARLRARNVWNSHQLLEFRLQGLTSKYEVTQYFIENPQIICLPG